LGTEASQKKLTFKLCVVSPLYHPSLGGVGRQAVALTESFQRKNLSVFVICRKMKGLPEWKPDRSVPILKLRTVFPHMHDLEEKTMKNFLISLSFCVNLIITLIKQRNDYDIVHFHGASLPLILSLLPLKIMKKKVVAKVAGAKMDIEAGSFRDKYLFVGNLFIVILKKVDAFIAISSEIRNDLLKDGFEEQNIHDIPNFIKEEEFHPEDRQDKIIAIKNRLGIDLDKKIITFSGRLVQRKRVDILFEAIAEIMKSRRDLQVMILGHGELKGKLELLAEEHNISSYIAFRNFVPNILDYLQITDIFVFPSVKEGMPNSLLEAMACRLPVVATRIGGVVDIVSDRENGLLVKPGSAEELRDALLTLLQDRQLSSEFAGKAYETIKRRYTIGRVADKYITLYEKLVHAV
jgi:glycosyltransferase involved in cell wall biosynthesis